MPIGTNTTAVPRLRKSVLLIAAGFLLLIGMSPTADAQQPPPNQKPLQLLLYSPMNVDGDVATASTTLQLHNPNNAAFKYTLAIRNATAKNTNLPADWVVAFYGSDNKPGGPMLEGTAAADRTFPVRVDLSHAIEAGESTAELQCNGAKIANLSLRKEQGLPFKVSLEGNPAEKPEIEFIQGSPLDLRFKNDDAMYYPVFWELSVKGKAVGDSVMVGPNGSTKFTVKPDDAWFSSWQSLFRSEAVDGVLALGYKPQGASGAYPSKTIPIKAKLTYFNSSARDVWTMIIILIILAIGGLASVYVNVDLVNRLKAITISKRVGQLARVIGEIGPQLTSPLRVSLWLERYRITGTLPHGALFTPETAATLAQLDDDTKALQKRVDLATQISDAIKREQAAINASGVAPSLMEQVTKNLADAQGLLKKSVLSDAEMQKIQSLLGAAVNILDRLGQEDDALEKAIGTRLEILKKQFDTSALGDMVCAQIKSQAPLPFTLLDQNPQPSSQSDRDMNTRKLAVIFDLVRMKSADAEIIACLARQDFGSLPTAELLLAQLKDKVSLDDLRAELTADPPRARIEIDRDAVRMNTSIMMKLLFNTARFNGVAAKRRIEVTWNFGHANFTEKGWEVDHYFPAVRPDPRSQNPLDKEPYRVTVTFKDIDQVPIPMPTPIALPVKVTQAKSEGRGHSAVELQRWAVGFFVALIGLFAGAKEKILSLDTASAIFAIFLLGFGIDMVKNLLVQKSS
jgi:hypothetical protein